MANLLFELFCYFMFSLYYIPALIAIDFRFQLQ